MKWIKVLFYIIFIVALVVSLGFTNNRYNSKICKEYRISLENESTSFISRGEIILLLESISDSIVGQPLHSLPLFEIERILEKLNKIENVEAYVLHDGHLQIEVTQKKPIVRVKTIYNKEFYMDSKGQLFDLSKNYTERLLVANGNIKDSIDLNHVKELANFIHSDSLWKSQIIQIYFKNNQEIELIPRVGGHSILLGDMINYKEKFEKLKLFYQKGIYQTGWNNYEQVNLKFKNQIVCVKK